MVSNMFRKLLVQKPTVFGMVHVGALPGSPLFSRSFEEITATACEEARELIKSGVDGVIIENMWDLPYCRTTEIEPETTAFMTKICSEIRRILPKPTPLGCQILAGANCEAVACAAASNLDFIRAEGFVFAHVADEGFIDGSAARLLRYRKNISAQNQIAILTDIKKKHSSHSITNDVSLTETAAAAEFFGSDGIILTGMATGKAASVQELNHVVGAINIPILIGSGLTLDNMEDYLNADAWIVGSHFKVHSDWRNPLCRKKMLAFMQTLEKIRSQN